MRNRLTGYFAAPQQHTYVIATTKHPPTPKDAKELTAKLVYLAKEEFDVNLVAICGCIAGEKQCYNIGLTVEGERHEEFIQTVTMALMPARYTTTTSPIDNGNWEF
jgi:hypothetical protein